MSNAVRKVTAAWHDLWIELGSPAATYPALDVITSEVIRSYFRGNYLGCQWFLSANISTDDDGDAISGVFAREGLALDTRRSMRMEPERDASLRATELNMTAGYAYGVIDAAMGCYYTADATAPS